MVRTCDARHLKRLQYSPLLGHPTRLHHAGTLHRTRALLCAGSFHGARMFPQLLLGGGGLGSWKLFSSPSTTLEYFPVNDWGVQLGSPDLYLLPLPLPRPHSCYSRAAAREGWCPFPPLLARQGYFSAIARGRRHGSYDLLDPLSHNSPLSISLGTRFVYRSNAYVCLSAATY